MKTLHRNKTRFYYALYEGNSPTVDEYGNITGEYERVYSNPMEQFANISSAKGETQTRQFGESENYNKVIVVDNDFPPINEYSVFWIDTLPELNDEGVTTTPYDYEVKVIGRSVNSISIAVVKVNVS